MRKEGIMSHLTFKFVRSAINILIYSRSRAGEFDTLHQCFLVYIYITVHKYKLCQPEILCKHFNECLKIYWNHISILDTCVFFISEMAKIYFSCFR